MALNTAILNQQFPKRLPIGQILVENGCILGKKLNAALSRQKAEPKKIGAILTSMNLCSARQVAHALALQNHLPWLCLENSKIENRIIELIPQKIAIQFKLVPVFCIKQKLVLVTEDPLNPELVKYLAELEYQAVLAVAPLDEVEALLTIYYRRPLIAEPISKTDLGEIPKKAQGEWAWPGKTGKKARISPSTFFDVSKTSHSKPVEVSDLYRSANIGSYSQKKGSDLFAVNYQAVEKGKKSIPFAGLRPSNAQWKAKTKKEDALSQDDASHPSPPDAVAKVTEIVKPSGNQNYVQAVAYFEAGIVKLKTGVLQEALELFEKSSELDPDNRVCRANIKRIQQRLKDKDIKGF